MNAALVEPRRWPRTRWGLLVTLVFAAHIGLILAFGDHKPIVPRQVSRVPVLHLATGSSELLALNDPTLFALPHRRDFAGAVWLQIRSPEFRLARWTEPLSWLDLPVEQLGSTFTQFAQTNRFAAFEFEAKPTPELTVPAPLPPEPAPVPRSTLRLDGDLAQRRLLSAINLPSCPSADLLTNSLVQALVTPEGNVFSAVLLQGSGSSNADQQAFGLARRMRFEPLRPSVNETAKLSVGTMIFEWHTVPLTPTNAPTHP